MSASDVNSIKIRKIEGSKLQTQESSSHLWWSSGDAVSRCKGKKMKDLESFMGANWPKLML